MRLADLKRFARALLPNVYITRGNLPVGVMGVAWLHEGTPMIAVSRSLEGRELDLTLLHEVAHHVYGDTRMRAAARGGLVREQWREDRADRWAGEMLALLQVARL